MIEDDNFEKNVILLKHYFVNVLGFISFDGKICIKIKKLKRNTFNKYK